MGSLYALSFTLAGGAPAEHGRHRGAHPRSGRCGHGRGAHALASPTPQYLCLGSVTGERT
jgi:hypothetical protein